MEWYYMDGQKRVGPVSEDALKQQALAGRITNETMVWHDGMDDWQDFGSVPDGPLIEIPSEPTANELPATQALDSIRVGYSVQESAITFGNVNIGPGSRASWPLGKLTFYPYSLTVTGPFLNIEIGYENIDEVKSFLFVMLDIKHHEPLVQESIVLKGPIWLLPSSFKQVVKKHSLPIPLGY